MFRLCLDENPRWFKLSKITCFLKKSPLLDNEHVRQDGLLGLGQDGPGPSCPNHLHDAL